MRASQGADVDPHGLLHMTEAVATEVLAAEPPRDHDDVVPQSLPFEHPKNDHAGSGFAVIILDHLIAADEAQGIMRGLGKSLVALQFRQKGPGLVGRAAWPARDGIFRTTISNDAVENDHAARPSCPPLRFRDGGLDTSL